MTTIETPNALPLAAPASPTVSGGVGTARQSAHDFEAMALGQFLQPMFESEENGGLFDGGEAETTLKPMLITEFAKLMEQRGGLGLAAPIEAKLEELQSGRKGAGA